jgi:hypothetical protein
MCHDKKEFRDGSVVWLWEKPIKNGDGALCKIILPKSQKRPLFLLARGFENRELPFSSSQSSSPRNAG